MADRKHFEYLDALRGIAAIAVVLYHFGRWRGLSGLATNGYLAVDFFFCLSGFVVARAYGEKRAPRLSISRFALTRLVRLMPLIVLASLATAIYLLLRLAVKPHHDAVRSLTVAFLLGSVSIPNFHAPSWIGGSQIFPLNGPQYTLFLEIFANLVWFALCKRLPLRGSIIVAGLSLAGVWLCGLGGDTAADFLSGFPRVAASFYAGVAVCQVRDRKPTLFSTKRALVVFLGLSTLLILTLFYPRALDPYAAIIWIALLSPAIVLTGSFCYAPQKAIVICNQLGELSYPIYTTHYPIFCWVNGLLQAFPSRPLAMDMPTYLILVGVGSWGVLTNFDRPIRRWLGRKTRSPGRFDRLSNQEELRRPA